MLATKSHTISLRLLGLGWLLLRENVHITANEV
uniref:Uncharacterized protein n=1 Tax=Rhizophora mucronata TaxID=61149 RepID=A0A2P2Q956_RHIMU